MTIFRCAEILTAKETMKAAEIAFSATIARIQDGCEHPMILERPSGMTGYQYIENSWFPAVRVCARCGYVEEARFGWPAHTTTDTPLYNTRRKSKSILNRMDFKIDTDRLHAEIVSRG